MSEIGLRSGTYSKLRDFSSLLDDALIAAKRNVPIPMHDAIRIVEVLTMGKGAALLGHYIETLVRDSDVQVDLQGAAAKLQEGKMDSELVKDLEQLAARIEIERSKLALHMRGR